MNEAFVKSKKIEQQVLKALQQNLGNKALNAKKIIESIDMRSKKINRKYDVPYLAGASNDGLTTYIDVRVPVRISVNGKIIDPAKYLNIHEQTERAIMIGLNIPYLKAHRVATAFEKATIEADDIDWIEYERIMDGYIRETEHESIKDLPPDLYKKPYQNTQANDAKIKPIILDPIRPNLGIQAAYRKKLYALIDEMHHSLVYWLSAAYKANTPEMASDASPARELQKVMKKLSKRWLKNFDEASKNLADYFSTAVADRADGALEAILKKSGFSVEFKMTAEMNDVMQATIGEQVGLIKSIAQHHLSEVEGLVMRSVSTGRDLKFLTDELQKHYQITRRRAAFIARSQNNMATATITRVRQKSLGATQAIWVHSGGGKEPRHSHVKAGREGLIYEIDKGAYLEGNGGKYEWVWPGTAINCRCVAKTIIPIG